MSVSSARVRDTSVPRGRALIAGVAAPLRRYVGTEAGGAGLLLAATVIALVWANSPVSSSYAAFWGTEVSFRAGDAQLALDLRHWVNDGLMVFFFFVVGLEIKRELVLGELTDRRRAVVPAVAAVTGLLVPALVYLAFNHAGAAAPAWGVVISTDTAFLLGVLALVGPAGGTQLRLFLLTLAITDDVGALAVIALFYTDHIAFGPLAVAAAGLGLMLGLRYLRVWRGPAYLVIAIGVWVAMERSGVHPTLAGVVIALLSPTYAARRDEVEDAARLTRAYRQSPNADFARAARLSIERSVAANERLQLLYHPWSSYVIVPIFALANAGVALDAGTLRSAATSPITLGIIAGLVLGKPLGILIGTFAAVRLGRGTLAPGLGWTQLSGGAVLSGMGFTIALFIVDLAFDDPALADQARVGVLASSLLAAALGWLVFRLGDRFRGDGPAGPPTKLVPPVDPTRDHIRGPADAPLTLVEYSDVECPFCGRATGVVEELQERLGDRLRYVFRHLPLVDVHPHAELAAEAIEAAGAQGRFWEMHDRLFAHQDQLVAPDLLDHAAAIGLDLPRFARDLGEGRFASRVREDAASAEASGVTGTPTFFVGGQRHTGPYDADTLAARLLATAGDQPLAAAAPRGGRPALGPLRRENRGNVQPPDAPRSGSLPEDLQETPDLDGAFPRLLPEQLAIVERRAVRRACAVGETLFREGQAGVDFFVVLSGIVAIVEDLGRETQQVVAVHGAGRFLGELDMMTGRVVTLTAVVARAAEVLQVAHADLRTVLRSEPELKDVIVRSFLLRRSLLLDLATELRIVGRSADPDGRRLRAWATERQIPHTFVDLDHDTGAGTLLSDLGVSRDELPVAIWRGQQVLRNPTIAQLDALVS